MHNKMQINGLQACINLPIAPKGEGVHSLPPYDLKNVYKVDDYPACPNNWMHGSGKAASYFLPVEEGRHMWLDFNNNWSHSHHVAIVLSVQGINPITGLPTRSLRLEQYRDKCIVHQKEFKADRYCEDCGNNVPGQYDGTPVTNFPGQWPPQNYMTTVSHEHSRLWIDGWRTEDGTIRGFLITNETMRGVAEQIIGEDRVWAIGIAFYLSKEPKPPTPPRSRIMRTTGMGKIGASMPSQALDYMAQSFGASNDTLSHSAEAQAMSSLRSALYTPGTDNLARNLSQGVGLPGGHGLRSASLPEPPSVPQVEVEKLEIGAGAKIRQELCRLDPNDPSYYKDEPEGLIYINYCSKSDFDKIMSAGTVDRTKNGEGFLSNLKTGN